MQNFIEQRVQRPRALPPYHCSAHYFWLGLKDWVAENTFARGSQPADTPVKQPASYVAAGLAVALLAIVALASVVMWASPSLVGGMAVLGSRNVAALAGLAAAAAAVLAVVGVPAWAGLRFWRGCQSLCRRGWELETGQRSAFRYA